MPNNIGFQKLAFAPRLTGAAIGAGLGAVAAPEEEGWTGAALGGMLGYGAGALTDRARGFLMRSAPGAAPAPTAGAMVTPPGMADVDAHLTGDALSKKIDAAAQAKGISLSPEEAARVRARLSQPAQPSAAAAATPPATPAPAAPAVPSPARPPPTRLTAGPSAPSAHSMVSPLALDSSRYLDRQHVRTPTSAVFGPARSAARPGTPLTASPVSLPADRAKTMAKAIAPVWGRPPPLLPNMRFKVGFAKIAEYGLSAGVPGLGLSLSRKDERLEGMNRWVPRSTIEHAYQGLEQGFDERALLEQAADASSLKHPLLGAALAAAAAHAASPAAHPGFKAVAGLVGGGAGALYSQMTAPSRVEDMRQAIRGVSRETGQDTAREAVPLVTTSGSVN